MGSNCGGRVFVVARMTRGQVLVVFEYELELVFGERVEAQIAEEAVVEVRPCGRLVIEPFDERIVRVDLACHVQMVRFEQIAERRLVETHETRIQRV